MENSKINENNSVNEYKASLKGQIKSLNGEIIFLRQELREKNVPAKCKCIASTVDDTEFHNINKSSNNNHNKNQNSSSSNIIKNLDNNLIFKYNTNDNTEYANNDNDISISNVNSNSNAVSATNSNSSNHNPLNTKFNCDNQSKYKYNKSYDNNANNLN